MLPSEVAAQPGLPDLTDEPAKTRQTSSIFDAMAATSTPDFPPAPPTIRALSPIRTRPSTTAQTQPQIPPRFP
ncbi:hypothetical protein C5E08_02620 [Rathayibacter iranicus]|uniref:Uncharacterized protein n=1 Tax=Rathayibacter iranicus TaxID=59737 RepID=A0AAD1AB10_9MICO|nr:hypothetical protein C7V51_02595 [Rathayibacter iranicus]PPI62515.1 hypothetical protein C5E08_02620 [Rathayibacter iranicus]